MVIEAKADAETPRIHQLALIEVALVSLMCLAYASLETRLPLNHDVAWLLDAGARWSQGEKLYVDLIEVNPPLVFYLYWLVTFGTWSKVSFIVGFVGIIWLAGLWTARLKGRWWGVGSVILSIAAGIADFGQRDQLAAIVAMPYLFAAAAGRLERSLIGIWAFAGFGLKPYLLLIPAFATFAQMLRDQSLRPFFSPENLMIGLLCIIYLPVVWFIFPDFFQKMIPLGNLVYFAYGTGLNMKLPMFIFVPIAVTVLSFGILRRELWPFVGAAIGGIVSFFVQGRFWSYHLVPAIELTSLVALLLVERRKLWFFIVLGFVFLLGEWLLLAKRRHYADLIPQGAVSVLFLSPHVGSAYPAVNKHEVRHASHYPAMWTLPGAWRLVHDPTTTPEKRRQAALVLHQTREIIIGDIIRYCPDPIFVDVRERKPYFKYPFSFEAFILKDPRIRNYRPDRRQDMYLLYRRTAPC